MQRFPDWPVRLETFLLTNQMRVFSWGRWDCCLFVADSIAAMTGRDPASRLRGSYSTYRGALEGAKSICGIRSIERCAEQMLLDAGAVPVPAPRAKRGDAVLAAEGRRRQIGIVALNGRDLLIATRIGIVRAPLSIAVKAWAI